MPYVIVGDEAFPLMTHVMRPYPGSGTQILSPEVRIYNYKLSRARRVIENTFGIMVSRWRILRRSIIGKTETVENIVKAITCLHNFLQIRSNQQRDQKKQHYCPPNYVDRENLNTGEIINGEWRSDTNNSMQDVGQLTSNMYTREAAHIRDNLKNYFYTVGSVPWQWTVCDVDMNQIS